MKWKSQLLLLTLLLAVPMVFAGGRRYRIRSPHYFA